MYQKYSELRNKDFDISEPTEFKQEEQKKDFIKQILTKQQLLQTGIENYDKFKDKFFVQQRLGMPPLEQSIRQAEGIDLVDKVGKQHVSGEEESLSEQSGYSKTES